MNHRNRTNEQSEKEWQEFFDYSAANESADSYKFTHNKVNSAPTVKPLATIGDFFPDKNDK